MADDATVLFGNTNTNTPAYTQQQIDDAIKNLQYSYFQTNPYKTDTPPEPASNYAEWVKSSAAPTQAPVAQKAGPDPRPNFNATMTASNASDAAPATSSDAAVSQRQPRSIIFRKTDGSEGDQTLPPNATAAQVDALTRNGWVPTTPDGSTYTTLDFMGGQVFFNPDTGTAEPLNVVMGQPLTSDQATAMEQLKQDPMFQQTFQSWQYWNKQNGGTGEPVPYGTNGYPGPAVTGPGGTGTPPNTEAPPPGQYGGPGTGTTSTGTPGPGVPVTNGAGKGGASPITVTGNDFQKQLQTMINNVYAKMPGAETMFGNAANFAQTLMNVVGNDRTKRDQLVASLQNPGEFESGLRQMVTDLRHQQDTQVSRTLEPAMGEIASTIGRENTGLSPAAQAALYGGAKENAARGYAQSAEQLKSMLASRGAYGGDMPGSEGDIVRGFSPLLAARENAVADANRQAVMADETMRQQNRAAGLQAAGLSGSLMGTLGSIYNPSPAISGALGAEQNRTATANTYGNIYDPNKTAAAASGATSTGNESYGNILKNLGLPFEAAPALGTVEAAKTGNALLPSLIGGAASNIDWNKLISKIPGMGPNNGGSPTGGGGSPNLSDTVDHSDAGGF